MATAEASHGSRYLLKGHGGSTLIDLKGQPGVKEFFRKEFSFNIARSS